MASRILVPLDGSSVAEKALSCAKMLGRELPAELVLFRAVSIPQEVQEMLVDQQPDDLLPQLLAEANNYLIKVAGEMQDAGLKVQHIVDQGRAAEAIVDCAAKANTELIVMATHGYSSAKRWTRGSVAERVLQSANSPVLMVCAYKHGSSVDLDPSRCRHILVPLDGSSIAEQVLPPVIAVAKPMGALVTLLRVSIVHTLGEFMGDFFMPLEGTLRTADKIAGRYLDRVSNRLAEQGVQVSTTVQMGAVAESIVDYAENHQIDLIAMCTHGRTGLGRWILGSVADRVLRAGCIPVLLVRAG